MTIKLVYVGKTFQPFIAEGCTEFMKRLSRYGKVEELIIPDVKRTGAAAPAALRKAEAELILKRCRPEDFLVILDEKGKQFSSVEFADFLGDKRNRAVKNLVFLVGGAYGFDLSVYERANEKISFSKMTFSHQMIRLFLAEQLYRAFTILGNEPYHNEG